MNFFESLEVIVRRCANAAMASCHGDIAAAAHVVARTFGISWERARQMIDLLGIRGMFN